jgi:hypothetical protein
MRFAQTAIGAAHNKLRIYLLKARDYHVSVTAGPDQVLRRIHILSVTRLVGALQARYFLPSVQIQPRIEPDAIQRHERQCVMPFDSVPGHHVFKHLERPPNPIWFHLVPNLNRAHRDLSQAHTQKSLPDLRRCLTVPPSEFWKSRSSHGRSLFPGEQ